MKNSWKAKDSVPLSTQVWGLMWRHDPIFAADTQRSELPPQGWCGAQLITFISSASVLLIHGCPCRLRGTGAPVSPGDASRKRKGPHICQAPVFLSSGLPEDQRQMCWGSCKKSADWLWPSSRFHCQRVPTVFEHFLFFLQIRHCVEEDMSVIFGNLDVAQSQSWTPFRKQTDYKKPKLGLSMFIWIVTICVPFVLAKDLTNLKSSQSWKNPCGWVECIWLSVMLVKAQKNCHVSSVIFIWKLKVTAVAVMFRCARWWKSVKSCLFTSKWQTEHIVV